MWLVRSSNERRTTGDSSRVGALAALLAAVPATAGVGGPPAAGAGRAERGGMTGNARFAALPEGADGAGAGGPANAAAGAGCDGCGRCGASPRAWVGPLPVVPVGVRAGDHARPGPDDMPPPRPEPENAGSRVATAMSRGAKPLTVAPGRVRGKRRTTGEDGDGAAAGCCGVDAVYWIAAGCRVAALLPAAAAVAGAGATERIDADDAGLTTAVERSSRELPAARSSAGPRGAGVAEVCAAADVAGCDSPPIEASAIPPAGRYDARPGAAAG